MEKYKEIWIVNLKDEDKEYNDCILLKGSNEYNDIELSGDCWFNELEISSVKSKITINSLKEVIDYCEKKDIRINSSRIINNGLLVGGEKDFLINESLIGNWV